MNSIAFLCVIFSLGCQQTIVQGTRLRLEMIAPQQAVLFLVHDDEVSYGGGLNAVENKTTWHGSMTATQYIKFTALITKWRLEKTNKFEGKGIGKFKIRLRERLEDNSFQRLLTDTTASDMYDLLMTVADKRFDKILDALPKPSVDAMLQNRGLGEEQ